MARFLICTVPFIGHVNPGIPMARRLVERGHEVWWYTGLAFQAKVEATGATFVPIMSSIDYSVLHNNPDADPTPDNASPKAAQPKLDPKRIFVDVVPGQMQDCRKILQDFPADVILADSLFLGAGWLYEQGGPTWAEFSSSVLGLTSRDTPPFGAGLSPKGGMFDRLRNRVLNLLYQRAWSRELFNHANQTRISLGLPRYPRKRWFDNISPFLYLVGTVPSFEYPRSDTPPQVHFIGPLLPPAPIDFTYPSWWHELKGDKPVIHVTQGTVSNAPDDLIAPTLAALAEEDVLVVATTGGNPIESIQLPTIPDNARIASFIPHAHLLSHVDVMVTNAGYNGVQMALANGVPLVAAGTTEEKPEVCARIAWSGVGINLKTRTPTPEQIKVAVKQLLSDRSYKAKAQQIQAEMRDYDAATIAAQLLEQLAETKQPVFANQQTFYNY
jgi:UDP:flavonoid glycosyltransferase YjiC (YdhE family)